ncbi:hypothetical protein [Dyadobacter sp. 676]|uniref:Uncharacterized protein n=1 Tax=Dyadobacter sp. 676 TaxID=3088362 RepID=A0AAU8FMW9_9BACT
MAEQISFPDQLCDWLISIGFRAVFLEKPGFALPVIGVFEDSRLRMEVIAVTFESWRKAQHELLPAELKKRLSATRDDGTRAVVVWEDYWAARKGIVRSRLAAMLGISTKIPARLTQVRRIDTATASAFLEGSHLNGSTASKFRYGLFLPERYYRILPHGFAMEKPAGEWMVAVATFSHARIFGQSDRPFRSHELIRFASLPGTNVVGALDKLLNAFIREKLPDDIMTYADLEWSDGRSYRQLGFEKKGEMMPRKVYVNTATGERTGKPFGAGDLPENPPKVYLTVCNLGSIKYVKTLKIARFNE